MRQGDQDVEVIELAVILPLGKGAVQAEGSTCSGVPGKIQNGYRLKYLRHCRGGHEDDQLAGPAPEVAEDSLKAQLFHLAVMAL